MPADARGGRRGPERVGEHGGVDPERPRHVWPDGPRGEQAAGLVGDVPTVVGERSRFVPHAVPCRDPHPHLPVEGVAEFGAVAADALVGAAGDDRGGRLDPLPFGNRDQPVGQHAGQPLLPRRGLHAAATVIDDAAPAEGHADVGGAAKTAVDRRIKPRQHRIILMEEVHELTAGQGDRAVPVARESEPPVVCEHLDAPRAIERPDEPLDVPGRGTVVHDGDLHVGGGFRLPEHRLQRGTEFLIGFERRHHHREPWPARRAAERRDAWRTGRGHGVLEEHGRPSWKGPLPAQPTAGAATHPGEVAGSAV